MSKSHQKFHTKLRIEIESLYVAPLIELAVCGSSIIGLLSWASLWHDLRHYCYRHIASARNVVK